MLGPKRQRAGGSVLVRALAFGIAAGLVVPANARAERQRVLLPVSVNEVRKGEFLALLDDGDVLLRVKDLEAAGVRDFGGRRETAAGEEFVSLASLATAVRYVLDADAVALSLAVVPERLERTVRDVGRGAPAGTVYTTDTSAFFNYAVNWRDLKTIDGFGEAGVSIGGNLLYASVTRDALGRFARGQTSFTVDDRAHLRRWVAGDGFVSAGALGGALLLGGVGVSRNFDLDPYFVRYPTLAFSGAVTTPSTAEIIVNGSVVRREQLPPGQFDFNNLSLPTGSGTARVVIRDAFGGERELTNPFYASTGVLARGLSEYTYNVGFRRETSAASSLGYDPSPAFLGRHRFGVTDAITPEMRLEIRPGRSSLWSGGPGVAARLPFGEVEASLAASRENGETGAAGSFGYRFIGRPLNFGLFGRMLSPRYANLSLPASGDRALFQANVFAGAQVGRSIGLTAQYEVARMRDTNRTERISLSASTALSRDANLFVSAGRSRRGTAAAIEAFVGLSYSLPGGAIASVTSEKSADGSAQTSFRAQKSLPPGPGLGYQVNTSSGAGRADASALLQYQGPYGRYEATYDRVGGRNTATFSASGGIVAIGGTVAATRAVGQSFALIRVPGVEGVAGFSSNQEVGRTNHRGDLLVPDVLPYYANRLGISDTDIALDHEIGATEREIAPPYRGGALVLFPVRRLKAVTGSVRLVTAGRETVPSYGLMTLTAGATRLESPIGSGGEFYFENMPPGRYPAAVLFQGSVCSFTLEIPSREKALLDVGTVVCP